MTWIAKIKVSDCCRGWVRLWPVCFLLIFLSAPECRAFVSYVNGNNQPQKWSLAPPSTLVHTNVVDRSAKAVRYFLSADGYSAANVTAELNAARACFDQWQEVPGSILRFEEGGLFSGDADVNTADNTNLVFWAKNSTIVNGGFDNISGLTAVTFSDYFSDGSLAESDIVLNGVEFTWFTDFNNPVNQGFFVEAVLLHEIGHFIGLAHSPIGAATMFPRGGPGVSVQAGLSADEIAAVHALYPNAATGASWARLTGKVTLRGAAVLGAVVVAEDANGNMSAGAVTRANGQYDMPGMPPGSYQVRVTPVDPTSIPRFLFRGTDISSDFSSAQTDFASTTNFPLNLMAGTTTLNFTVSGSAPFRITRIRPPAVDPSIIVVVNYPVAIPVGLSDVVVGAYSSDTFSSNATLRVSGNGLILGPTTFKADVFPGATPPLNLLSVPIHLTDEAAPGVRSLIVQDQTNIAYANGFLEISTPFPDYNFDGLDDRFQRQFFPRWTVPEAGPTADPDNDGYDNTAEYLSGTNPTDSNSVLRVESVRLDSSGATVTWPSAPGKKYQVFTRPQFSSALSWQAVGDPVVADGNSSQFIDTTALGNLRFYRIQAVPP